MIGQTWRPIPRSQSSCGKLAIATNTSDKDSIIRKIVTRWSTPCPGHF